jgi:predicted  nucleic acid-binding Zn-ribbon protein
MPQCLECGNPFDRNKMWQKYCSRECNQASYLKRKVERKRGNPLAALDLDLDLGPSPAQEAEWQRRTDLADQHSKEQQIEDAARRKAKAKVVVEQVDEIMKSEPSMLERLNYGKPEGWKG